MGPDRRAQHKNVNMRILFNEKFLDYNQGSNYEGSYRLKGFKDHYKNTNIDFNPTPFILNTHSKKYFEKIKKACLNKNELVGLHLSEDCFDAAILAVGLTIKASEKGNIAIVRPPGHHASKEKASGFCLFNSIVIAVNRLISLNQKVRVGILDMDGHHGDGTQSLIKDNENIFFCSVHQSEVFPGTGMNSRDNYFNIPLKAPISEQIYLEAIDECIQKIAAFSPDILAVSVGFDTYENDRLLDFNLKADSYRDIGKRLALNFHKIFSVLEGGYHTEIRECVENFVVGINSAINK